jgi:hypothetical protein
MENAGETDRTNNQTNQQTKQTNIHTDPLCQQHTQTIRPKIHPIIGARLTNRKNRSQITKSNQITPRCHYTIEPCPTHHQSSDNQNKFTNTHTIISHVYLS